VAAASPAAREAVIGGAPLPWRVRRSDNAVHLLGLIAGLAIAEPVFDEWPAGAAPLGLVLAFRSEEVRDRVRETLREEGVYCPVHWRIERPASERVRDLSTRVLTIPTDWRYTDADMERVASILREAESRE
jgi:dTDP-4-amino-4,6-dideoxygalactose transaminase